MSTICEQIFSLSEIFVWDLGVFATNEWFVAMENVFQCMLLKCISWCTE